MTKENEPIINRIVWAQLAKTDQEGLRSTIESQARDYLQTHPENISHASLKRVGLGSLAKAIGRFYPGGFSQLKTNLELPSSPNIDYIQTQINDDGLPVDKGGKIWWQKIPPEKRAEMIEKVAQNSLSAGTITPGFRRAIHDYYPGGITALKEKLGMRLKRPPDYWTPKKIEAEAQKVIAAGGRLSQSYLLKTKQAYLTAAIKEKYPGGIRALKKKLSLKSRQPEGYWTPGHIETEARDLLATHKSFSISLLKQLGRNDLLIAINRKYPGGISALREKLALTPVYHPAGYWTPERIEEEVARLSKSGVSISSKSLKNHGYSKLASAIAENYPGKWRALKTKLGLKIAKRSSDWTPDGIEAAVRPYIKDNHLTEQMLLENGRSDLTNIIRKLYPGRMNGLKLKLGLIIEQKPDGYWTRVNILTEVNQLIAQGVDITPANLQRIGRKDLDGAIGREIGWRNFRKLIGLQNRKEKEDWPKETIEREAAAFVAAGNRLTAVQLAKLGRNDLAHAITAHYEGGMPKLREKLGLKEPKKPNGYWTPENIKREARDFYQQFGQLTTKETYRQHRHDLWKAINDKYPGGFSALRKDLGIELVNQINTEEANAQIEAILKD